MLLKFLFMILNGYGSKCSKDTKISLPTKNERDINIGVRPDFHNGTAIIEEPDPVTISGLTSSNI